MGRVSRFLTTHQHN